MAKYRGLEEVPLADEAGGGLKPSRDAPVDVQIESLADEAGGGLKRWLYVTGQAAKKFPSPMRRGVD